MNRKDFIKNCGLACVGGSLLTSVIQGCAAARTFNCDIADTDLLVPLEHFVSRKNGQTAYKKSIVVYNELLQYPICVFRHSESSYTALWMRCTHQGAELQVFGDTLQCPAHGSEFDNRGGLRNGPAEQPLRSFPLLTENGHLKISLK